MNGERVWCDCRENGISSPPDEDCDKCHGLNRKVWYCEYCGEIHLHRPNECERS